MDFPIVLGRYVLYEPFAKGGMASVHLGRVVGPAGFSRTVAIKRMHPHLASDPRFVAMFLDEARVAARVQHPNVVPMLDVVATNDEVFLVMEYVHGGPLSYFAKRAREAGQPLPVPIAAQIVAGALHGLHAAHEARDERGESLRIIHRDVSPQNILVGTDGVARVMDFGVAKAVGRAEETATGQIKGKIAYMAPEQIRGKNMGRGVDVYAAGVVLWETLLGRRMIDTANDVEAMYQLLESTPERPDALRSDVPEALADLVMKALSKDPADRFATAEEMALALETAVPVLPASTVAKWVTESAREFLDERTADLARVERDESDPAARALLAHGVASARTTGPMPIVVADAPSVATGASAVAMSTPRPRGREHLVWYVAAASLAAIVVGGAWLAFRAREARDGHSDAPATRAAEPAQPAAPAAAPPRTPPVDASASAAPPAQTAPPPSATAAPPDTAKAKKPAAVPTPPRAGGPSKPPGGLYQRD